MSFFSDLFSGNFLKAKDDVTKSFAKLPSWAQTFITTLASAEGQILINLAETGAKDVLANGLTTASFTAAAKDISSKLVSQNITLGTQTVYSALNAVVAASTPVVPATVVQ